MDHVVRLSHREEAALQAIADSFVAEHKGDVMKALKAMIVYNGHLQEQLQANSGPRPAARKQRPILDRPQRQFAF